jgi:hypothetical protein
MKETILAMSLLVLLTSISTIMAEPSAAGYALEPPALESGHIEVNGGKIFYEAAGHGPPVIMIHDGVLHRETWDSQFAVFAAHCRVIRWDRRGYGRI